MKIIYFKRFLITFSLSSLSLVSCATTSKPVNNPPSKPAALTTQVVSGETAKTNQETWGTFLSYYEGQSDHLTDILTGVAIINPGEEIHPPHKHPEEEFLMVIEGQGTWSVKGVESPAVAGDILFSVPGEYHGIKNTGNTPLKFVVFKYNPKP